MRGKPYRVVVLLRSNPHGPRTEFLQNFHKRGDARIGFGAASLLREQWVFRDSGRDGNRRWAEAASATAAASAAVAIKAVSEDGSVTERIRVAAKEIAVGCGDSGKFLAGHGVPAEKERALGRRGKSAAASCVMRSLVLQASVTSAFGDATRAISGSKSSVAPIGRAM
jgi:hypothetical protein